MSNPDQSEIPFSKSIDGYIDRRYKSSLQRRVDAREQRILRELLTKYPGTRNKNILDLPCGYGRFVPLLKDLGYDICAMDISPLMVKQVSTDPQWTIRDIAGTADIRSGLPLADSGVGAVICIRLFQHLHYPEWRQKALKEFVRVCDGPIVVTFYDRKCLHYWTKQLLALMKRKPVRVQMLSRTTFENDIRAAGLEVVEYRAKLPYIHAQTFAVLRRRNQIRS